MSTPLKDFRLGITESIDMWLDAVAISNRTDKAQIAREILQEWADRKMHEHRLYARRARTNGLQPELPGLEPEDDGAERNGPRGRGRR